MGRHHAKGRHAVGECQRSGKVVPYRDLVEDGHIPGLLVARDWWEPQHPQEIPPDMTDPIALRRPAPEISIPPGEGDPEVGGAGTCAASPDTDYLATTTLASALAVGATHVPLEDAVTYEFAECIYIQRDDGSWFVSKATSGTNSPTYTVTLTTGVTLVGSAFSAGNSVYISVTGSGALAPLPGAINLIDIETRNTRTVASGTNAVADFTLQSNGTTRTRHEFTGAFVEDSVPGMWWSLGETADIGALYEVRYISLDITGDGTFFFSGGAINEWGVIDGNFAQLIRDQISHGIGTVSSETVWQIRDVATQTLQDSCTVTHVSTIVA